MLGALDLLVALGRDDLPISPENVDEPILTYCKKPCASARDNSVCSVSLPSNLLRTMTLQPISKKSNTTSIFPQGRGVNTPPASCNKTAHTDDRINLSQSSRSSQRPMLVIGEALKKSLPF